MFKGGIWWFLVFAGTIAAAAFVRFAVNGGFASGSAAEKILYPVMGLLALLAIAAGLRQVVVRGRQIEPENENDDELRIT